MNAVAQDEVDVQIGYVRNGLPVVIKRHVAEIDLPVVIAWRAGIVGVIRRTALSEGGADGEEAEDEQGSQQQGNICSTAWILRCGKAGQNAAIPKTNPVCPSRIRFGSGLHQRRVVEF